MEYQHLNDPADSGRSKPPDCVLVSDPVQIAGLALLQTLDQARRQLERRVDWGQIEARLAKLMRRLEAGLKLLSLQRPINAPLCSGSLLEVLTELTVEATVAAEAGQWRWAWSTTTVAATLRRMRADLKRAFVAAEVAVVVAPESSEAIDLSLQPSTPPLASPRRRCSGRRTPPDLLVGEPLDDPACLSPDAGLSGVDARDYEGVIAELAAGLRLRPIRVGRTGQ